MIDIQMVRLIDLVPPNLRNDPTISAAAESLDRQLKDVTTLIPQLSIVHHIDTLPEQWVDELAWQWHVDFYDPDLSLEQRRDLVKNALPWHKRKGTPSAVAELIAAVFDTGEVLEWFEYGGEPYHFKVVTSDPSATTEKAKEFIAAINSVKNERSWLEAIEITTESTMELYFANVLHIGDHITIEQVV
ncbi:phage tail protein I [Paenibacillaceae bacterium]|nr:phage tail protein I [Paenibacillaceae bacterium]